MSIAIGAILVVNGLVGFSRNTAPSAPCWRCDR